MATSCVLGRGERLRFVLLTAILLIPGTVSAESVAPAHDEVPPMQACPRDDPDCCKIGTGRIPSVFAYLRYCMTRAGSP